MESTPSNACLSLSLQSFKMTFTLTPGDTSPASAPALTVASAPAMTVASAMPSTPAMTVTSTMPSTPAMAATLAVTTPEYMELDGFGTAVMTSDGNVGRSLGSAVKDDEFRVHVLHMKDVFESSKQPPRLAPESPCRSVDDLFQPGSVIETFPLHEVCEVSDDEANQVMLLDDWWYTHYCAECHEVTSVCPCANK